MTYLPSHVQTRAAIKDACTFLQGFEPYFEEFHFHRFGDRGEYVGARARDLRRHALVA
jgi:hypothetical protein